MKYAWKTIWHIEIMTAAAMVWSQYIEAIDSNIYDPLTEPYKFWND